MKNPLISVIIPTYNRANYISETINSVINQTYNNFEIIIIDDGSTDNTKNLVNSINDNRIKYFWQENKGYPAPARNNGFRKSNGEYIAFLDSDDLWYPKKIEKQLIAFQQNSNLLLISTNFETFSNNSSSKFLTIAKKFYPYYKNQLLCFKNLLKMNYIVSSSILMKKEVIDKIGYINEEFRVAEDYDYWLRLLKYKNYSVLYLNEILVKYRMHSKNFSDFSKMDLVYFPTVCNIFKQYEDYDKIYIQKSLNNHYSNEVLLKLYQNRISFLKYIKGKNVRMSKKIIGCIKYFIRKLLKHP